jgi:hypothetical protein
VAGPHPPTKPQKPKTPSRYFVFLETTKIYLKYTIQYKLLIYLILLNYVKHTK